MARGGSLDVNGEVKSGGSSPDIQLRRLGVGIGGEGGMSGVAVKCLDIRRNTRSERGKLAVN